MTQPTQRHLVTPTLRLDLLVFDRGQTHVLTFRPGDQVVVGREGPLELRLDAAGLSRRHARFTWDDTGPAVADLGSTNGTQLNGRRVDRASLAPGDIVSVGEVRIAAVARDDDAPALLPVERYEAFTARLADELLRARTFGRGFGLLRIRALSPAHASRFAADVQSALRPVDRLGAFADGELLALLPEADAAETKRQGKAVLARCELPLGVSMAVFPGDGADAHALLGAVSSATAQLRRGQTLTHAVVRAAPGQPVVASAVMRALFEKATRAGTSGIRVLIGGETGSGKEVLARAVHDASPRRAGPFVAVNCGAIAPTLLEATLFGHERGAFTGANRRAKGLFEQADGGTLFLDEVGELPLAAQVVLLRALETGRFTRVGGESEVSVDVRVVAATHRNLEAAVLAGVFRADLRFRLEGVLLVVPSLRERRDELEPLAQRFLHEFSVRRPRPVTTVAPDALAALQAWPWPGNVRELRNVIERAVALCAAETVTLADLPEAMAQRSGAASSREAPPTSGEVLPPDTALQEFIATRQRELERLLISRALAQCGGNQTRAAKLLKLPLRTLVHKLKTLELR